MIGPVVAPAGTVAIISVVELVVKLASVPLNRTALGLIKFVPVMVTVVPETPEPGENALMVGVEFAAPLMTNGGEMLKKTFPIASTLTRLFELGVPGTVMVSEPSFGVEFARVIGKLNPPSVESEILTFGQLTGALFVLATFHVTV